MIDRGLRAAAAALVVLVAVWAGARVYSSRMAIKTGALRTPVGEASAPTPSDLSDPPASPGLAPPAVKIPALLPEFSLRDLSGKLTPVKEWAGKSLVINFWATWCAPCRREVPMLEELAGVWAGRGVAVVGIAIDQPEAVSRFAKELKIPYPLLVGEQDALDVAGALGLESPVFPFTVFTDRRGEVVALYVGELHRAQADLILAVVQNLNQDRVALTEARRSIAEGLRALTAAQPG
jgi:thiol-disulfide isomerase/thioredoxin